jgi:hypothetical protein
MAALPTDDSIQYQLQHEDSAVNIVYTNLDPLSTYEYLEYRNDPDDATRNIATTGYGPALTQAANTAITEHVTASGIALPSAFINHMRNHGGQGVLLVEARAATDKPLKLIIKRNGTTIAEASLPLKITPVRLKTVSFSGPQNITVWADDAGADQLALVPPEKLYAVPHMQRVYSATIDKQRRYSTAYVRNTKASIGATFEVAGISGGVRIRASGPNGMTIPETMAGIVGTTAILPATEMTVAFPDTVKYYNRKQAEKSFHLKWEMEIAGQWLTVGITRHTIYVSLAYPVTTLRQETLFDIACSEADGETTDALITARIWSIFSSRDVRRVDDKKLTYYKDYNITYYFPHELLQHTDGQCGSWARLFLDARKIHGIFAINQYVRFVPDEPSSILEQYRGFLVKNWNFSNTGHSGIADYPYLNIPDTSPFVAATSYNWKYADVSDASGLPGQNNNNPASVFNNHQVVYINGIYYDPSMGIMHASIEAMDDTAIDGFLFPKNENLNETSLGIDLDGDGATTSTSVQTFFYSIRKNPSGTNIIVRRETY